MTPEEIELKYQELCNTPTDMYEHLPKIREYADRCDHVTEFGVRYCNSLFAELASKAKKVVGIDIVDRPVPEVDKLQFICANDLEIEIEPTDFLFIDTCHTYGHLQQELRLHGNKARKYLGFHDVVTFGEIGEDGSAGLMKAINEFMAENPHWVIDYHSLSCNGLMILRRVVEEAAE